MELRKAVLGGSVELRKAVPLRGRLVRLGGRLVPVFRLDPWKALWHGLTLEKEVEGAVARFDPRKDVCVRMVGYWLKDTVTRWVRT